MISDSPSRSGIPAAPCETKGSGDWSIGMGRSGKILSHLVCKTYELLAVSSMFLIGLKRPLYGSKTSLFEKAHWYLLDDEASPDHSIKT
jgi:hypothetical protein